VSCKLLGRLSVVNHRTLGLSRAATAQTTRSNTDRQRFCSRFLASREPSGSSCPPPKCHHGWDFDMSRRLKIHTTQWANRGSVLFVATHTHPLRPRPFIQGLDWIVQATKVTSKGSPFAREHTPITWSTKSLLLGAANGSGSFARRLTGSTPPWQRKRG
jgi:hypothetical protein